jgi:transcriptional pleiotropic regulator of transition state genes
MKSTGIVRKIDTLGRIVLPKELRNTLDIAENDSIEIYIDAENIIFRKYNPGCIMCGEVLNVKNFKGKNICNTCVTNIFSK